MKKIVGYSLPGEGYCVHDESGTTWGEHPDCYSGPLLFLEDETGMVTAVGREATQEQQSLLQDDTIPWSSEIPFDEAVVSANNVMEAIDMLFDGP